MNIQVKVLFFAKSREIAGKNTDLLNVHSNVPYEDLLDLIANKYNLHTIRNNIILAVNEEYCVQGQVVQLKLGDEIAVIPPLSGG